MLQTLHKVLSLATEGGCGGRIRCGDWFVQLWVASCVLEPAQLLPMFLDGPQMLSSFLLQPLDLVLIRFCQHCLARVLALETIKLCLTGNEQKLKCLELSLEIRKLCM